MASVYALRLFIRAMHNRVGPKVESREIALRDGAVLVPLVAVIVFLALVPPARAAPQRRLGQGAVVRRGAAHGASSPPASPATSDAIHRSRAPTIDLRSRWR